ncbi:hypothetical protein C8024_15680 [Sphingopyxis sp. BSNA05]|nr:hypothetical protein [Sphingopyxis sp. BSNA05]
MQNGLPEEASGAFVERALNRLIADKLIEQGGSDTLRTDLYALTDHGIEAAESLIEERGIRVEDYVPSPDADVILSRISDPTLYSDLISGFAELGVELDRSNSAAEELGTSMEPIKAEISAASTLMQSGAVRVSRLQGLILPTLKFLSEKFTGGAVGELAKRLVNLLLGSG